MEEANTEPWGVTPAWTAIRVQGGKEAPQMFEEALSEDAPIANANAGCPSCGKPIQAGDRVAAVPLGPGDNPEDRKRRRKAGWYSAMAAIVHADCLGIEHEPGQATHLLGAADTIHEVAVEVARREKENHQDSARSEALIELAEHVKEASELIARAEELWK